MKIQYLSFLLLSCSNAYFDESQLYKFRSLFNIQQSCNIKKFCPGNRSKAHKVEEQTRSKNFLLITQVSNLDEAKLTNISIRTYGKSFYYPEEK